MNKKRVQFHETWGQITSLLVSLRYSIPPKDKRRKKVVANHIVSKINLCWQLLPSLISLNKKGQVKDYWVSYIETLLLYADEVGFFATDEVIQKKL